MYESYYGLSEKPFNITPDTDFYFQSVTHQNALNVLLVAIKSGDGFIKLTGEVGTGKTLLCRKLLDLLDDHYCTIYIPNPYMSCDLLLRAVVDEMGLSESLQGDNYLSCINKKLIENAQNNIQTIILLDEAQSLPVESLEAIRLLSNLETEKKKLIQIVLFGQPELDIKLQQNSIRQLQQRISHSCQISGLSVEALSHYIQHRLISAGYHGPQLFNDGAIKYLFKCTQGVPRLINLLCNKAMMLAYASGDFSISRQHIKMAFQDHQNKTGVPGWKLWFATILMTLSGILVMSQLGNNAL